MIADIKVGDVVKLSSGVVGHVMDFSGFLPSSDGSSYQLVEVLTKRGRSWEHPSDVVKVQ